MPTLAKTTTEDVGSRKGGGDIRTGDAWESRVYCVYYTDYTASSLDARNAAGVPAWGDVLTGYALACVEKYAEPDPGDQKVWRVTATFRTPQVNMQTPNPDPGTVHKWNISKTIVPQPMELPVTQDISGKIIANCIGEPPNPPLTGTTYDFQVNIGFDTDAADQSNIESCLGKVNLDDVTLTIGGVNWDFPSGELKLQSSPIEEVYDTDGNLIAHVTLQCVWRPGGWVNKFPNLSFNQIVSGDVVPILDSFGQPVSEPRYLDASGVPIATGGSIVTNSATTIASVIFAGLLNEIT